MRQLSARINVTLPKELIESVNRIAGPRSRSRLIAKSLREELDAIDKAMKIHLALP
jgi:metal-responsive CopG/Arc/MetJ family transcriptional regulator